MTYKIEEANEMKGDEAKNTLAESKDRKTEPDDLRELDAEVARMLEPQLPEFDPDCALLLLEPPKLSPKRGWSHVHIFDHGDVCEWEPRPFSRSIAAAMEVLETLQQRGFAVSFKRHDTLSQWVLSATDLAKVERVEAGCTQVFIKPTLPETICRAALALVDNPVTKEGSDEA